MSRRVDLIVKAEQAFLGPWPASRQSVPGRDRRSQAVTLVVPDRFGFPTDMGCIGHVEGPATTFLCASSAQRASEVENVRP